jgi:hypothetical protein
MKKNKNSLAKRENIAPLAPFFLFLILFLFKNRWLGGKRAGR